MGKIYPHSQWKDTGDSKETVDGEPALVTKLEIGDTSTHITKDGDGNMVFTDAVTGELTLAELEGGGGGGVDTSGTPVDNDYAKFTDADTIEGRSYTEVKQDLSLEDSDINALITATKLDDLTAPDDTEDLDATDALHGLMSKADKGKLDAIEAGADQTDATNVAAAGAVMADGSVPVTGYIDITEAAEPANPAANNLRLHALDENGFSILAYKDSGGMVRKFVKDAVFIAYNDSGDTIAAPRAVYASGSTGTVPTIALAKADSSDTMPAIGVTLESIANGAYGRIMQVGLLEDVNTLAFTTGDILYVSAATAGMPTATPPAYPNIRQELGTVLVDSETVGSIQIIARTAFDDSLISIVPSLEGSPTEDEATKAPTSEWAFDHNASFETHASRHEAGGVDQIHSMADDDDDTKIQVEESADEDIIRMDIEGTERVSFGDAAGNVTADHWLFGSSAGIMSSPKQSKAGGYQVGGTSQVIPSATYCRLLITTELFDEQNELNTTVKTGAADATEAGYLNDEDGGFAASDVGAWIWNTTDNTYTTVKTFGDSGRLELNDDIMADGEGYKLYHSTFTATEDGTYVIVSTGTLVNLGDGKKIIVSINVNNSGVGYGRTTVGGTDYAGMTAATVQALSANDVVDANIYHNHGSNLNMASAAEATNLYIAKMA